MARPVLVYTLLRIVLFVGSFGLVTLAGLRAVPALIAALVLSAVGSLVLLKRQRDAIADVAEQRKTDSLSEKQRLQARLRDEA